MVHKKTPASKKKFALIMIAALLVVGSGIGYWALNKDDESKPLNVGEVNYNPPTKNDKKETEQHKKELEKSQNSVKSPPATTINPTANQHAAVITYLSATEARGYVSDVFEDGGTCTITLTKGSSKVTASSTGIMDVNKTTCGPMSINQGQLTSGDWTAILSYTSSKSNGTSASQKLSVP